MSAPWRLHGRAVASLCSESTSRWSMRWSTAPRPGVRSGAVPANIAGPHAPASRTASFTCRTHVPLVRHATVNPPARLFSRSAAESAFATERGAIGSLWPSEGAPPHRHLRRPGHIVELGALPRVTKPVPRASRRSAWSSARPEFATFRRRLSPARHRRGICSTPAALLADHASRDRRVVRPDPCCRCR